MSGKARIRSCVLACALLLVGPGCSKSPHAVVAGAALSPPASHAADPRGTWEYAQVAHRVVAGPSTVLLLREFDPGDFWVIDDESFRKVSVVLPSPLPDAGEMALGPGTDLRVIAGGSAWPQAASAALGARSGTLRWSHDWLGRLRVEIDATVVMAPVVPGRVGARGPEPLRITWRGVVRARTLGQLSPFQGNHAGRFSIAETYP